MLFRSKDLWEQLLIQVNRHSDIKFCRVKGHLNINNTKDMEKWYKKFLEWNGNDFTKEDFLYVTKMNIEADDLANKGIDQVRVAQL